MTFCVDCKHYNEIDERCDSPKNPPNVVTGKTTRPLCALSRINGACGRFGLLFEPKIARLPWWRRLI